MRVTLKQVADAIENNGWKQFFGAFTPGDWNKLYKEAINDGVRDPQPLEFAACAVAQAALNLHTDPESLHSILNELGIDTGDEYTEWANFGDYIADNNDTNRDDLKTIAEKFRDVIIGFENETIEIRLVQPNETLDGKTYEEWWNAKSTT